MAYLNVLCWVLLLLLQPLRTVATVGSLKDAEHYWERQDGREWCEYRMEQFGNNYGCGRLRRLMKGTSDPGLRLRMAREFWVMQIVESVWQQERAQIGRFAPAFRRMVAHDRKHLESQPGVPWPRNVLNTDRLPPELQSEIEKMNRRYRERALKYIARIDALWKNHRPKQKLELHDVIGEDEHRSLWDVAAVKAAEKYLNSFYSADVRRARFWKTGEPANGLHIPHQLMKVRPLPRNGDATRPPLGPHDYDKALDRFRKDHGHPQSPTGPPDKTYRYGDEKKW